VHVTNPVVDAVSLGTISSPLSGEFSGSQVTLKGTFGLFVPGNLVVPLVSAKGEMISQGDLQSADPREVVRLSKTLGLLAGAFRVSVFSRDGIGHNRGFLGNSIFGLNTSFLI
jgi:hypothetical protein